MSFNTTFTSPEPPRSAIDAAAGLTLLEFGTPWCGYCKAAQPLLATALAAQPDLHHLKIEDGSGRPLGRSFKVKLWPTLILLRDGKEVARTVRPAGVADISGLFAGQDR